MTEQLAKLMAEEFGMTAFQSGGNIWLVRGRNRDGNLVVISDEVVAVYHDDDAFDAGDNTQAIWFGK